MSIFWSLECVFPKCTFSGPQLNQRGLVWYLLNSWKARAAALRAPALRGLDKNEIIINASSTNVSWSAGQNKGQDHCFIFTPCPLFHPVDQLTWLLLQIMLFSFLCEGKVAAPVCEVSQIIQIEQDDIHIHSWLSTFCHLTYDILLKTLAYVWILGCLTL